MSQTQQDETLLEKFEIEIREAGDCTVIDLLKEISPYEFELENMRHQQEWDNLLQKLKYRSSIERKKELLNLELDSTIDYLDSNEEGELRHIFGDLSQTKLHNVIEKVKSIAQVFMKSHEWKILDYKQKQQFLAIKNLKSDLIKENMPYKQAYRILLKKMGLRILTDKDKKKENITLNRQVSQLINGLFYDHFQVELNRKIQIELKNYLPENHHQLLEVNPSTNELSPVIKIEWNGTQKELAELFVELHRKKWIDEIPSKLIKQYFTKSDTIEQVLKPTQDSKTKEKNYEGIFTTAYRPRFDTIRQSSKKQ